MTEGNRETREIPTGWCWIDLGEILDCIEAGKSFRCEERPPREHEVGVAKVSAVTWGEYNELESKTCQDTSRIEERFLIRHGDFLFSRANTIELVGACVIARKVDLKVMLSDKTLRLKFSKDLNEKYILYFLRCKYGRDEIKRLATGNQESMRNIRQGRIKAIRMPFPSINEQNRIVEKIEELFSDIEQGIESLKTAQKQLKVYRQAVLKWAFEGKLTEEWRKQQSTLKTGEALLAQIKAERENLYQQQLAEWEEKVREWEAIGKVGKKPTKPQQLKDFLSLAESDVSNLPQLPNSWLYVEIELFLAFDEKAMITGPFGTMLKKSDHKDVGVPVLGIENIGNGVFIPRNKIFVSEEKAKELDSFGVTGGDIIISRSGTVGEICCIPEGRGLSLISTNLMRLSLDPKVINSKFFVYLFQGGGTVKEQVKELCKGSTRDFLNQNILKSIKFPLPSFEEQEEIVQEIESRLSICDQLEATIIENLQKAEALRQSILKQAFEGKLVPQDPNDEPAEKLLERIQAEQQVNGNTGKKSKPSHQQLTLQEL